MVLSLFVIFLLIGFVVIFYEYRKVDKNKICFKENCFNIEIADNNFERQQGLMSRKELCSDCGMLFIYEQEDNYKFWMKNTLIPLDIIWMDENFVVQYVAYEILSCEIEDCPFYSPPKEIKSDYVLEVNSRIAKIVGLKISEKMVLK